MLLAAYHNWENGFSPSFFIRDRPTENLVSNQAARREVSVRYADKGNDAVLVIIFMSS